LQNEETDNGGFDRMYNKLGITSKCNPRLQNPGIPFTLFAGFPDASGMGVKGLS
jgi:hypothetical protein